MKRYIFLLLAFLSINICVIAQDTIKIKGVPVQSKFDTFVREIKNKGFEAVFERDGEMMFSGTFLNEKCYLVVKNANGNVADVIIALTHKYSSWESIKSKSDDIVELFTKRFGKPGKTIYRYEYPYKEGDGDELIALRLGKLRYARYFYVSGYMISISLTNECDIMICYTNEKEFKKKQDERINDI